MTPWTRAWMWTRLDRLHVRYVRWTADSHTADSARLLDAARACLDLPRMRSAERSPSCSRCGEDLRDRDEAGAHGGDGIHARCYGQ